MKIIYWSLCVLLLAESCQSATESVSVVEAPAVTKDSVTIKPPLPTVTMNKEKVVGYYVGDFKSVKPSTYNQHIPYHKITLSIDTMAQGVIKGHSIVAGNLRPFSGTYALTDSGYQIKAQEPGDNPYDGTFSFTIVPGEYPINGTWQANRRQLRGSEKEYRLERRDYGYDPTLPLPNYLAHARMRDQNGKLIETNQEVWYDEEEEYTHYDVDGELLTPDVLKFNASVTALRPEDVENMYKADLEVLRNSIYARHGYSFKNKRMRYVFDHHVDWYMPVSTDVRATLTEVELANIALIKRYEEHATNYYDAFGR